MHLHCTLHIQCTHVHVYMYMKKIVMGGQTSQRSLNSGYFELSSVGNMHNLSGTRVCTCTVHVQCTLHIVHDLISEPQLPWLRTAIYHMGLDVKSKSHSVHWMPTPGFISCAGVTGSGRITCHVHVTLFMMTTCMCRCLLCVWGHLDVWGELASHKRLFNPPSQFSRLGILVSSSVLLVVYRYMCTCTCTFIVYFVCVGCLFSLPTHT